MSSTLHEIFTRTYLLIGTIGLLSMVPLAVTSTNGMVTAAGRTRWKALHRLAYVTAIAGALHYYLLVKSDIRQPLAFAAVLALLLGFRVVRDLLDRRKVPARGGLAARPTATVRPGASVGTNGAPGASDGGRRGAKAPLLVRRAPGGAACSTRRPTCGPSG